MKHDQDLALEVHRARDLAPREDAAAVLLAIASNHRAITWQREQRPPSGNKPAAPLDPRAAQELAGKTLEALEAYAVFLSEREAAALLACAQIPPDADQTDAPPRKGRLTQGEVAPRTKFCGRPGRFQRVSASN